MTQRMQLLARLGLALLLLFPGLILAPLAGAQPQPNGPPKAEGLVVYPDGAVDVRHLPPPAAEARGGAKLRHFPDLELLLEHKEGLQKKGPGAPPAPEPGPSAVTPSGAGPAAPGLSAQGLRQSESGGWYPPDTQVAAGPGHIFQAVNLEGRIWTKSPLEAVRTFNLCTFFGLSSCNFASDPKIRFDPASGRWFVVLITYKSPTGTWKLAVSTSSDPTGTYAIYTIASKSGTFPDFPAVGISDDRVVLTANAFTFSGFFQGTEFVVLNKTQLTAGTTVNGQFFGPPQGLFTIQPAHSLSPTSTLYMAAVAFNSATSIRIWSVNGVPGVSSVTVSTVNRSIATLSSPPDAKQRDTSALIETNDNRLLDAAYRSGSLWVSANSACTPSGDTAVRACLRFMQILAAGLTIAQSFDVGDFGTYYYYPAVQTDGSNNLVTVFSGSSATQYASVYASGQQAGASGTFGIPVLIKAGERVYTPRRWGDYSGAGIDPSDPTKVWVAGEYAFNNGSSSEWGTWIAEVGL